MIKVFDVFTCFVQTGQSRCFAFVYYQNVEDAVKAKEASNGVVIVYNDILN